MDALETALKEYLHIDYERKTTYFSRRSKYAGPFTGDWRTKGFDYGFKKLRKGLLMMCSEITGRKIREEVLKVQQYVRRSCI